MRQHYSYMFSYRPEVDQPQMPTLTDSDSDDENAEPQGNFSSIHYGGRLAQQFFVDAYAKVEEHACGTLRRPGMQKKLKAEMYTKLRKDLINAAASRPGYVEPGYARVLPASFIGSPRYMHQAYNKAMAISMHTGAPHKFITMTANPKWPEVVQNLLPGQSPEDRPDLLARVFKLKLDELLKDLIQREIFGEIGGYAWTIEYQKRGMPHVHILLIQKHKEDMPKTGRDIDLIVSAEIPDKRIDTVLYEAVKRNLIHGPCGNLNPSAVCMQSDTCKGKCKRFFPKEFASETLFDENGYPQYMRRKDQQTIDRLGKYENLTSQWVVPFNPFLLLKYDTHINVEIATSIKSFKYLYKYIYKGGDKVEFKLRKIQEEGEEVSFLDSDEIKDFQDARYLSSHEACWRMFGFPTNAMSHCVESLQVHLPNQQEVSFIPGTANLVAQAPAPQTTLTAYFKLCEGGTGISATATAMARTLLYHDMPQYFTFDTKSKSWKLRPRAPPIKVPWSYSGTRPIIGRMHHVSPADIERYCLRLLLLHIKGPKNFEALKLHNDIQHRTFHEAAIARDLMVDDKEWNNCLTEANFTMMPDKMISLFACILISCNPSDPKQLWDNHKMNMFKPDRHNNISDSQQLCRIYDRLNAMIQRHDSEKNLLQSFQIPRPQSLPPRNRPTANPAPPPTQAPTQTTAQTLTQTTTETLPSQTGQDMYAQLNLDQKTAFDRIYNAQDQRTKECFFIDGPGGTGKSFMYKTLIHCLQQSGKSCVVVASTGIAATLLDGVTAHKAFKMPLIINHDTVSKLRAQSKEAAILRTTDVIIWDESTASHRYALELLDRLLKFLCKSQEPFAGKTIVLGGDFRQTLPIVIRGSGSQQVAASIRMSPLWDHFTTIALTENMRAKDCPDWAEWLLKVGDGLLGEDIMLDSRIHIVHRTQDLIDATFGKDFSQNMLPTLYDRVLLTPTNKHAAILNEHMLSLIPGPDNIRLSIDTPVIDKTQQCHKIILPTEFLKTLTPPGLPPHSLNLKVGGVYMLLRNMNVKEGLCNGSRFHILEIQHHSILCQLIPSGPGTHNEEPLIFLLPRITSTTPEKYPFTFSRHQFPIRPSFAMTINKSQGSTYSKVGIDLTDPVFSHGQLYVALSRVKNWDSVHVLLKDGQIHTKNIVWHTIFDKDYIDRRHRECFAPPAYANPIDPDEEQYEENYQAPEYPCSFREPEDNPYRLPEDLPLPFSGSFASYLDQAHEGDDIDMPADWNFD